MVEDTKESGWTTKCMEWDSILGEMDVSMKANTNLTKSMDLELILGLTDVNMSVNGWTVRDMVKAKLYQSKVTRDKEFGNKTNEFVG